VHDLLAASAVASPLAECCAAEVAFAISPHRVEALEQDADSAGVVRNAYFTPPVTQARKKAVDKDSLERRQRLERANRVFIHRLRVAVLSGLEIPAGVLGHEHGPRSPRRSS
jgi:hypothetical protein